jgi:SAM-dependent methyltransferase
MQAVKAIAKRLPEPVKKPLRVLWSMWFRFSHEPLEWLPDAPDLFPVYRRLQNHPELSRKPGGWIYRGNYYPDYLTVGGASPAIYSTAVKHCQGKGADIGAGLWPLAGAIPVDLARGAGSGQNISDFGECSLDYVFSSHCLEHIEDWRSSLVDWLKRLKPGGIIFLYLPHPECAIWQPGSPFVGDGHKWIPTPEIIKLALSNQDCHVVASDDGPDAMQSFFVCGKKRLA